MIGDKDMIIKDWLTKNRIFLREKNILKLLIVFSMLFLSSAFGEELMQSRKNIPQKKYRLYTIYTKSHESLLRKYFLPSIKDPFEVHVQKIDQDCESANYNASGWGQTMAKKNSLIVETINQHNEGEVFVLSDCDIIFVRPVLEELLRNVDGYDFVIQANAGGPQLCSGFIVIRANERTKQYFTEIENELLSGCKNETFATSNVLKRNNHPNLVWKRLSLDFASDGLYVKQGSGLWTPAFSENLYIPKNIGFFHANYCKGVKHKELFLETFLEQYLKKQKETSELELK